MTFHGVGMDFFLELHIAQNNSALVNQWAIIGAFMHYVVLSSMVLELRRVPLLLL